jgi:hypothetical protein
MSCDRDFYLIFEDYRYVLVYETDAWVFKDELDFFCGKNLDWIGAPWPHQEDKVGNSGFSLRKVSKMLELTGKHKFNFESVRGNCDTWFCLTHGKEMDIADLETAVNFSVENMSPKYKNLIKDIPMGMHGKMTLKYRKDPDSLKGK